MFDDILFSRRREYALLEWANRNGWLATVDCLIPFEIAILAFPYTAIDQEEEEELYLSEESNFLTLSSGIFDAVDNGELKADIINLGDYRPEFKFDLYGGFGRYNDSFGGYSSCEQWLKTFQFTHTTHIYKKCPIPLIFREDFKRWRISKGDWPLPETCLLRKWFAESDEDSPALTPSTSNVLPFPAPQRSDEWREMMLAVIKCYEAEHGAYPAWAAFWSYLTANLPVDFHITFEKGKPGIREDILVMGGVERITKTNLKKRFDRLPKIDR